MMLEETEIKACAELVARAERDIGGFLSVGQIVDLIADNRCDRHHEWTLEKCKEMAARLTSGHGVGGFHRIQARLALGLGKR